MLTLLLVELIHVKQTHHKEDMKFNNQGKGIIVIGEDLYRPSLVSNHFEFINKIFEMKLKLLQGDVSEWGDMTIHGLLFQ
jgi:hypothetical protein